jgi:hypothetical protein
MVEHKSVYMRKEMSAPCRHVSIHLSITSLQHRDAPQQSREFYTYKVSYSILLYPRRAYKLGHSMVMLSGLHHRALRVDDYVNFLVITRSAKRQLVEVQLGRKTETTLELTLSNGISLHRVSHICKSATGGMIGTCASILE